VSGDEGGAPPLDSGASGRPGALEKPQHFQDYWWKFMAPLPSQVLSPLRRALSIHRRRPARLRNIDAARHALREFKAKAQVTAESVDDRCRELGMEVPDLTDAAKVATFFDRFGDAGLKGLAKRDRVAMAIAYAEMTLEWLDSELSRG
jgi:hypothetical protein